MTEKPHDYPPDEPEGTQPRLPKEGVPDNEIVGTTKGAPKSGDPTRPPHPPEPDRPEAPPPSRRT